MTRKGDWGQLVMWEAVYDDGSKYQQIRPGGIENGFKDMIKGKVREFRLYNDGKLLSSVSLNKNQRVIYRRLVEQKDGIHVLGKWPFKGFNPKWNKEEIMRNLQPQFLTKCEVLVSQGAIKNGDNIFPHVNTDDGTFQIAKGIHSLEVVYLIGSYDKIFGNYVLKYIFEDGTVIEKSKFESGTKWFGEPKIDRWEIK